MNTLIGLLLYTLIFLALLLLVGLLDAVTSALPRAVRYAWYRWRDRKLQGQGCVVLRRHRARLEHKS